MGKHGEFTVEVSAKDGAIDRITVLDSRETPGMGDVAMEKMTQAIIDNQTLAVDTISGATLTSGLPHRRGQRPGCDGGERGRLEESRASRLGERR